MPKTFQIENIKSGVILGTYEAKDEHDALDLMARDAGYPDYAAVQAQPELAAGDGEVLVTEVTDAK